MIWRMCPYGVLPTNSCITRGLTPLTVMIHPYAVLPTEMDNAPKVQ